MTKDRRPKFDQMEDDRNIPVAGRRPQKKNNERLCKAISNNGCGATPGNLVC